MAVTNPVPEVFEGLTWLSLLYVPGTELGQVVGPDQHDRCETPKHKFGEFKPPAEWLELLWYPTGNRSVARAWKTCEACHVGMAQSAERVPGGATSGGTTGDSG